MGRIFPDFTNSKYDVKYHQLKALSSDIRRFLNQSGGASGNRSAGSGTDDLGDTIGRTTPPAEEDTPPTTVKDQGPITVIVGTTVGAPSVGATTWTDPRFVNKWVQVFLGNILVPFIDYALGITKNFEDDFFTFNDYVIANGDIITVVLIDDEAEILNNQNPRTYIVGIDSGAPAAGTSSWTLAAFANSWVKLYINNIPVLYIDNGEDPYLQKNYTENVIYLSNYTFSNGDILTYSIKSKPTSSSTKQPKTYKVGTDVGAPTAGTNTWTLPAFVNNYIELFIGNIPVLYEDNGVDPWLSNKVYGSDTITINNYTWNSGDILTYFLS